MSTSGYEIRHALLNESKEMLYERWHMEMDVERICAERENRSPVVLPYPTVEDIKRTAENLYEFVQKRSRSKQYVKLSETLRQFGRVCIVVDCTSFVNWNINTVGSNPTLGSIKTKGTKVIPLVPLSFVRQDNQSISRFRLCPRRGTVSSLLYTQPHLLSPLGKSDRP